MIFGRQSISTNRFIHPNLLLHNTSENQAVRPMVFEDIFDIYTQAEAIKKKLIDLKNRLKEFKKSDA